MPSDEIEIRLVGKKRLVVRKRRTADRAAQIQSPPITPMSEDMMMIVDTAKTMAPGRPTAGLMLHSNVPSGPLMGSSRLAGESFTGRTLGAGE